MARPSVVYFEELNCYDKKNFGRLVDMLKLLLVSPNRESLSGLASALVEHGDVDLSWAESGEEALDIASETAVDLVVTDERLGDMSGLELAGRLLSVNPIRFLLI